MKSRRVALMVLLPLGLLLLSSTAGANEGWYPDAEVFGGDAEVFGGDAEVVNPADLPKEEAIAPAGVDTPGVAAPDTGAEDVANPGKDETSKGGGGGCAVSFGVATGASAALFLAVFLLSLLFVFRRPRRERG